MDDRRMKLPLQRIKGRPQPPDLHLLAPGQRGQLFAQSLEFQPQLLVVGFHFEYLSHATTQAAKVRDHRIS